MINVVVSTYGVNLENLSAANFEPNYVFESLETVDSIDVKVLFDNNLSHVAILFGKSVILTVLPMVLWPFCIPTTRHG